MFFGLEILFACAAFVWLKEVVSDWFARLSGGGGRNQAQSVASTRRSQRPFRFVTPLGDSLKKGGKPKGGKICSRT